MSVQPVLMPVPAIDTPRARHLSRHLSPLDRHRLHAVNRLRSDGQRRSAGTTPGPSQERPSAVLNARPTGHSRARRGRSWLGLYVSACVNRHIVAWARGSARKFVACPSAHDPPCQSTYLQLAIRTYSSVATPSCSSAHATPSWPHCVEWWITTTRWRIEASRRA